MDFIFGYSNVTITNTKLGYLVTQDSSFVSVSGSLIGVLTFPIGSPIANISNSVIEQELVADYSSIVWLVNSTYSSYNIRRLARVYVCWYLAVHVVDLEGNDVYYANVTVTYPNGTLVKKKMVDVNGSVSFTLVEKMMNASGIYPIGNYTVTATYKNHSGEQTVNITGNKQITIRLPFIIPEFPTILILPLLIIATLITVIFGKTIPSNERKGEKQT